MSPTASSTIVVERQRLAAQLELAGLEPRDVEQIVDEPADEVDLAADDAAHALGHGLVGLVLHDLDRGLQRLERIAQLVGEDREELVLAAVGLVHLRHLALERFGLESLALHRAARARGRGSGRRAAARPCACSSSVRSCSSMNTRRLRAQHLGADRLHQEVERAELVALEDLRRPARTGR